MGIDLFARIIAAYDCAVYMLAQVRKAAIVHPTGTVKNYIAFKLIEDNPDKKILRLSPSEYIFKAQLENIRRDAPDGTMLKNWLQRQKRFLKRGEVSNLPSGQVARLMDLVSSA